MESFKEALIWGNFASSSRLAHRNLSDVGEPLTTLLQVDGDKMDKDVEEILNIDDEELVVTSSLSFTLLENVRWVRSN